MSLRLILRKIYIVCQILFPGLRQRNIIKVMSSYDMIGEEDEKFFQKIYMYFIEEKINKVFGKKQLNILDAGCGQGRIAIPLAQMGHKVVAIDLSDKVINEAQNYARCAGVNVNFYTGDINKELGKIPKNHFDVIISMEVLYMLPMYEDIIDKMIQVLKPGGWIFLSLRPRLFYVYFSIMKRDFRTAEELVLNESKYSGVLSCLSKEEMISLLKTKHIKNIETKGIGILCGIKGDPQAYFAIPSVLTEMEQNMLLALELKLSGKYPDSARYVIVSGTKESD